MFALIVISYFIGFQLSNNLVPSSYMIEFALGKRILWGVDWGFFYRNYENYMPHLEHLYKENAISFSSSFPFRIYLKEFTALKRVKTSLLLTFTPNYFFNRTSINGVKDTQTTKSRHKTWQLGINLGFTFDSYLDYKGLPFKLRFYVDFVESFYSEEIIENIEIKNSTENRSTRIKKGIGISVENPLKNEISVYLIFEL